MRTSLRVFLILLSLCAFPGCDQSLSKVFPEILPLIKTSSRGISLFHWVPLSRVTRNAAGSESEYQNAAKNYLGRVTGQFWNSSIGPNSWDRMGYGLYLAVDPIASREFGGRAEWSLITVKIPAQTRMLDLMAPRPLTAKAKKIMKKKGCAGATELRNLFYTKNAKCRALGQVLVRELAIDTLLFPYSSTSFDFCPYSREAGLVLVNPGLLAKSEVSAFSSRAPESDSLSLVAQRIQELFIRSRSGSLWSDLTSRLELSDMASWGSENLLGCGNYPEDHLEVSP